MQATRRQGERRAEGPPWSPGSRSNRDYAPPGRRRQLRVRRGVVARGLGWRAVSQERSKDGGGFVEPPPPLRVGHADRVVVALRWSRAQLRRCSPVGKQIERGESFGQGHWATKRDERHSCRQLHRAGSLDHGGQGGRAVQPRPLKQKVIVGGDRGKGAFPRGVDSASETSERLPLVSELHERQVNSQLQAGADPLIAKPVCAFAISGPRTRVWKARSGCGTAQPDLVRSGGPLDGDRLRLCCAAHVHPDHHDPHSA